MWKIYSAIKCIFMYTFNIVQHSSYQNERKLLIKKDPSEVRPSRKRFVLWLKKWQGTRHLTSQLPSKHKNKHSAVISNMIHFIFKIFLHASLRNMNFRIQRASWRQTYDMFLIFYFFFKCKTCKERIKTKWRSD